MKFSFCALFLVACTGGQDGYLVTSQTSQGFGCLDQPFGCGFRADYQGEQVTLTSQNPSATRIGTLTAEGVDKLEQLVRGLPAIPPTFTANCADSQVITFDVQFDDTRTYQTETSGCASGSLKPMSTFLSDIHLAIINGCSNHPFVVCVAQ